MISMPLDTEQIFFFFAMSRLVPCMTIAKLSKNRHSIDRSLFKHRLNFNDIFIIPPIYLATHSKSIYSNLRLLWRQFNGYHLTTNVKCQRLLITYFCFPSTHAQSIVSLLFYGNFFFKNTYIAMSNGHAT